MPDKYSYRASKKKKTVRRPTVARPAPTTEDEIEAELTPVSDIQPIISTKPVAAARPITIPRPEVSNEGRGISRVSNLGAELRRLVIIAGLILIVLVVASLVLK